MKLSEVNIKLAILNAWHLASRQNQNKAAWVFVSELCGCGSNSATELCREAGLNPEEPLGRDNQPKWGDK